MSPAADKNPLHEHRVATELEGRKDNTLVDHTTNNTVALNNCTPIKNKFDVLETEDELQNAFENLQRANDLTHPGNSAVKDKHQNLEIVLAEEHIEYLSDGAGTRDMSNIGVHFQSATNSDGEMDSQNFGGTRTKKNKRTTGAMRRSTRIVKEKKDSKIYQY